MKWSLACLGLVVAPSIASANASVAGPVEIAQNAHAHDVARGSDGALLATWSDANEELHAVRVTPSEGSSGSTPVTLPAQTHDAIRLSAHVALAPGATAAPYVVVWHEPSRFRFVRIAAEGTLLDTSGFDLASTAAAEIEQYNMALACSSVACLLVWLENGPGSAVMAQRFRVDGSAPDPVLTLAPSGHVPRVSCLEHLFLVTYGEPLATYVSDTRTDTTNPSLPTASPSLVIDAVRDSWSFLWTTSGAADNKVWSYRDPNGHSPPVEVDVGSAILPLAVFDDGDPDIVVGARANGMLVAGRLDFAGLLEPGLEDLATSSPRNIYERRITSLGDNRFVVTQVSAIAELQAWTVTIMGPPLEPDVLVCSSGINPDGTCAYGDDTSSTGGCGCHTTRPSSGSWPLVVALVSVVRRRRRAA